MMIHEMEGKPLSLNRSGVDLLRKIRVITRSIVEDLCTGRLPTIYINQFSSYCHEVSGNCYCRLGLPKDQSVVDGAINDICILLECSRHNLNVVSVGNGLVMGWLRFKEAGRVFDCISSPNVAHHIPVHVEDVEDIISVSEYILVVEKESVFQRLANDQFCRQNRCIVITGRGYPDVPTRRFLHLLTEKLCLPVYCLVDCDPYGIDILTTYRFGSTQMAYDSKSLRLPVMHWLGAFPSDSEKYEIPQQCLLPLTAEDKQKAKSMLSRCYMEREVPHWRSQLQLMLDREVKFEIEALSANSITFLSESYVPSKIRRGDYI